VPSPTEALAEVGGVNVHAKVVIDGRDRKRLEGLCRYVRLSTTDQAEMPDGRGACEVAGKHGPMPFRAASELRMLAPLRERRGARDVDASRACDRA